MKLTDDDFTSHTCDDPSKDGDGLGWNLDTDMTTEGKNELIQNQKLRELVDERIEILSRPDAPDSRVVKVVLNVCEKLLEDCKK